jgi:hypothetical protein
MNRRIGDRRAKSRFEIVGDLWGSIDASASLEIRNLGSGGALLESPDSMHWLSAVLDGDPHPIRIRVRHSVKDVAPNRSRYLLGVEFVSLTPAAREFIQRQINTARSDAAEAV